MKLDDKFGPVRTAFYEVVGNFFKKIASFLGYPQNIGMPTIADLSSEEYAKMEFKPLIGLSLNENKIRNLRVGI